MRVVTASKPDEAAPCDVAIDDDCLKLPDFPGAPRNKVSLLVIAGQHNWLDEDDAGFQDDLDTVFDPDNDNNDDDFYAHSGNDRILVIEEL